MPKRKTVVIKRSQWLNPNTAPKSNPSLWNSARDLGCCLGLCLIQEGMSTEEIEDRAMPSSLNLEHIPQPCQDAWINEETWSDSLLASLAARVNDARDRKLLLAGLDGAFWGEPEDPTYQRIREMALKLPRGRISIEDRIRLLRPIFKAAGYSIRWLPNA